MRKVTQQTATALITGQNVSVGNTMVVDGKMYLHGNLIADITGPSLLLTLAGWNTPTTRERLNGVLQVAGIDGGFHQKNFAAMYNDKAIDPNKWIDPIIGDEVIL